jgi:hypothetical protein
VYLQKRTIARMAQEKQLVTDRLHETIRLLKNQMEANK